MGKKREKRNKKIIKKVSHAISCGRQNSMDPTSTFHYPTLWSSVAGSGSLLMTEVSCVTDLCYALPPSPHTHLPHSSISSYPSSFPPSLLRFLQPYPSLRLRLNLHDRTRSFRLVLCSQFGITLWGNFRHCCNARQLI